MPHIPLAKKLRDLLGKQELLDQLRWDDAAQLCLALALYPTKPDDPLTRKLRFQREGDKAWYSPQRYTPADIAQALGQSRALLDDWLKTQTPAGN